jgi:hypothetical protein
MSAPAALTPRNFSRDTIDMVKMPSGTAEPNWRKAHSKVPSCRCEKKATISFTLAVGPGKYGIPPSAVTGIRPAKKSTTKTVATIPEFGPRKRVRVSLEATGIYSLDLAFALDAAEGIEVAVLNPKVANRFAQTIRRSKTDAADAEVLAEYTHRMPFTAWIAPSASSMRLRAIVRHVETLSVQSAQNQNRLHAAHGSASTPGCVVRDLKRSVASLELRIRGLRREAMTLVRQDDLLR